jgi:hypothetical protein
MRFILGDKNRGANGSRRRRITQAKRIRTCGRKGSDMEILTKLSKDIMPKTF